MNVRLSVSLACVFLCMSMYVCVRVTQRIVFTPFRVRHFRLRINSRSSNDLANVNCIHKPHLFVQLSYTMFAFFLLIGIRIRCFYRCWAFSTRLPFPVLAKMTTPAAYFMYVSRSDDIFFIPFALSSLNAFHFRNTHTHRERKRERKRVRKWLPVNLARCDLLLRIHHIPSKTNEHFHNSCLKKFAAS